MAQVYPDVTVDTSRPDKLLHFYTVHGFLVLGINVTGVFLVVKNKKIEKVYKGFMLNMQCLAMIGDFHMTVLMQPVVFLPIIAGYTEGVWWNVFRLSSNLQMSVFLFFLLTQMAAITTILIAKHRNLTSLGYKVLVHRYVFWSFVVLSHSMFPFPAFGLYFSVLSRQEAEQLIRTKFPNALNILSIPNVDIYDFKDSMEIGAFYFSGVLLTAISLSSFFSVDLFRVLHKQKAKISSKNYASHQTAIRSLVAQALLPMAVVLVPFSINNYLNIHVIAGVQTLSNINMGIYSLHSPIATVVMIISTPQYRKWFKRKFRGKPNAILVEQISTPSPSKTSFLRHFSKSCC